MDRKKGKKKDRVEDHAGMDELEPIDLLIEDFEKFNDVERSFSQITEIENHKEKISILIDFSRYLTDNGSFTEAKIFAAMIEETFSDESEALAE
jgi:hypothetical protein